MDNLLQVSSETLEEVTTDSTNQEFIDTSSLTYQPRLSAITARMPEYSTSLIDNATTDGIYPHRAATGLRATFYSESDDYYIPTRSDYTAEVLSNYFDGVTSSVSSRSVRMSHSYNNDILNPVGYFKIPNENIDVKIYTKARPTQETLDELYDLFKWTFHDN